MEECVTSVGRSPSRPIRPFAALREEPGRREKPAGPLGLDSAERNERRGGRWRGRKGASAHAQRCATLRSLARSLGRGWEEPPEAHAEAFEFDNQPAVTSPHLSFFFVFVLCASCCWLASRPVEKNRRAAARLRRRPVRLFSRSPLRVAILFLSFCFVSRARSIGPEASAIRAFHIFATSPTSKCPQALSRPCLTTRAEPTHTVTNHTSFPSFTVITLNANSSVNTFTNWSRTTQCNNIQTMTLFYALLRLALACCACFASCICILMYPSYLESFHPVCYQLSFLSCMDAMNEITMAFISGLSWTFAPPTPGLSLALHVPELVVKNRIPSLL